jgi:hypothetical protein
MEWSNSQKEPTKNWINHGGLGGANYNQPFQMFPGCTSRGFKIAVPINLGWFEYRRITVTSREDDYGRGINNDGNCNGGKG